MRRISVVLAVLALLVVMLGSAVPAMADQGNGNDWWNQGDNSGNQGNDWGNQGNDWGNQGNDWGNQGSNYGGNQSCDWYWSYWYGWTQWCWSPWWGWYQIW
jgi:hypothetical protein